MPEQRHTARRIFDRLKVEHGHRGSYSQVQTAVKRAKQYSKEAFVPLSHPPGHAQVDFGPGWSDPTSTSFSYTG